MYVILYRKTSKRRPVGLINSRKEPPLLSLQNTLSDAITCLHPHELVLPASQDTMEQKALQHSPRNTSKKQSTLRILRRVEL